MKQANDIFSAMPGYRSFIGSQSVEDTTSFFLNVYETAEEAQASNDYVMKQNAEEDYVMGTIIPTMGEIMFDYMCSAGNSPAQKDVPALGGGPSSAFANSIYVGVYGAVAFFCQHILFSTRDIPGDLEFHVEMLFYNLKCLYLE